MGWGSVGVSCPPPEEESATPGGRPVPTPGAGTPARATVSWREMFPKMSASPWEEEGGEVEGGEGDRAPPPPILRPPGLPAGACGTCGRPPAAPPCPGALPGGSEGGGGARAAGAPPAHPTYPSRSGCVPPPIETRGGGVGMFPRVARALARRRVRSSRRSLR